MCQVFRESQNKYCGRFELPIDLWDTAICCDGLQDVPSGCFILVEGAEEELEQAVPRRKDVKTSDAEKGYACEKDACECCLQVVAELHGCGSVKTVFLEIIYQGVCIIQLKVPALVELPG